MQSRRIESIKHIRRSIVGFLLMAGVTSLPLAADSAAGFIHLTPEQVPFRHPAGLEQVILFGDPDKPGIYVVRYRFPPGMHSNPHYHSQDRQITVIKGVWYMGMGDKAELASAIPMPAGSYAFHPARAVHWDGAGPGGETVVQVIGMGPVETVPVNPKAPEFGTFPK
jgi:quercetin dioxygenase-like cupin family protein